MSGGSRTAGGNIAEEFGQGGGGVLWRNKTALPLHKVVKKDLKIGDIVRVLKVINQFFQDHNKHFRLSVTNP